MNMEIAEIITRSLKEDCIEQDITSLACIDPDTVVSADFLLKEDAKIAGLAFLPAFFSGLDISFAVNEGEECKAQTVLARVKGPAQSILSRERSALNFLQHASAIATLTARFVKEVADLECDILDTRKTLPSLRALQKYAVRIGGGKNHRYDLASHFLIKDNHLAKGTIKEAIARARKFDPDKIIEVEVTTLAQLEEALQAMPERILLDNMSLEEMQKAVILAKGRAYLEASGGITLACVRSVAETGVNGISIGALTHSACAIDISLEF
jgi:nicotinate-nucleotide pyrophosphorylase (carboxylating)